SDSSGRDNHGSLAGQEEVGGSLPVVETGGVIGKALHATEGEYVSLAGLGDYQFGEETDFSVSIWIKGAQGSWSGDPAFFGTKSWTSGDNAGFVVPVSGNGFRWNWKGSTGPRRDTASMGSLNDGNWHNIIVSHDRDGHAYFYLDGALRGIQSIAGDGDITALEMNLLQDGTGGYGFNSDRSARFFDVRLDDVGIWNRILTPQEAGTIYAQGLKGEDLTTASFVPGAAEISIGSITRNGSNITINWTGAAGVKLQKTSSLTNPSWSDVAGTDGQSTATITANEGAAFFRLVR
ncbi:MAG: LamG domain-containing protein, partial [Verrucomicrobiales bacterium]